MTNPNLNTDQQTTALNNGVKQLQDGLTALNSIAANQQANSLLVFSGGAAAPTAAASAAPAVPAGGTGVDQAINSAINANAPSGTGGGT
jgi:X-X-X-Leu-X-X-Gly heptad repeat protein